VKTSSFINTTISYSNKINRHNIVRDTTDITSSPTSQTGCESRLSVLLAGKTSSLRQL